jgi:ribosome assembly protein RRB1
MKISLKLIKLHRQVDYLLASGSDSGEFSIWDLRSWPSSSATSPPLPAASFKWHKQPITSLDWHPTESSVIAVAGGDHQVTLWDLALERDPEEEAPYMTGVKGDLTSVPPQLLFIHQGQKHIKEIKWHRQIPGVLISTAYDGFNVFKTINS